MKFKTLEELIKQRVGYKYLNKDRTSPHQKYKYVLRKNKIFETDLNTDSACQCGAGWNLATLEWILNDCGDLLNSIIVEFEIPNQAIIISPQKSTGKFRTNIVRYKKIHNPEDLFPEVTNILSRVKKYKPINPITATKMPPEKEIKKLMASVRASVRASVWDSVRDSVWDSVWASVRDSVRASVWASVWASVRASVRASVWDSVWDSVWASVRDSVRDSVRASVRDSVRVVSYFAVKEFMDLKYEHPAFDLIRLGVIVVPFENKYMVFGKNGQHLGYIKIN